MWGGEAGSEGGYSEWSRGVRGVLECAAGPAISVCVSGLPLEAVTGVRSSSYQLEIIIPPISRDNLDSLHFFPFHMIDVLAMAAGPSGFKMRATKHPALPHLE